MQDLRVEQLKAMGEAEGLKFVRGALDWADAVTYWLIVSHGFNSGVLVDKDPQFPTFEVFVENDVGEIDHVEKFDHPKAAVEKLLVLMQ